MANKERNKKLLLEIMKQPDNSHCADCGAPGELTSCSVSYEEKKPKRLIDIYHW